MVAVLAEASVETDPVEEWLVEQITYLTDEWFERRRFNQDGWDKSLCPWCRRLREMHLSHLRCPICAQIRRSKKQDELSRQIDELENPDPEEDDD